MGTNEFDTACNQLRFPRHGSHRARGRQLQIRSDWGDYSFCSQLIKWDDDGKVIRFAHYHRLSVFSRSCAYAHRGKARASARHGLGSAR